MLASPHAFRHLQERPRSHHGPRHRLRRRRRWGCSHGRAFFRCERRPGRRECRRRHERRFRVCL
ncbi:hypothetical protein ACFPRL_12530 [Pseudoclavibacter helvolus]